MSKRIIPLFVLKRAVIICTLSKHPNHKIGAVIFHRKGIISTGFNYPERSLKRFTRFFMVHPTSVHAEVAAIINSRQNIKGRSIFVLRLNKKGEMRLAKPCNYCMGYINFVGLKSIYFSTNNQTIERIFLNGR